MPSPPATVSGSCFRWKADVPYKRSRKSSNSWAGRACSRTSPTSRTPPGHPGPDRLRRGRPLRPGRSEVRATTPRPLRPRAGGPRRGARQRHLRPPGAQLRRRRRLRVRPADRRGGDHPRRQLVLVPAAQARRAPAGRGVGAGGDLLLRDRRPRRPRLPTGVPVPRGRRGRARRGPLRRRRPRPRRLARPVHRPARARHVLPERHGGSGGRPGVAHPLPPRPHHRGYR